MARKFWNDDLLDDDRHVMARPFVAISIAVFVATCWLVVGILERILVWLR